MSISIKSQEEIEIMRSAGKILAATHEAIASNIKVGTNAKVLDDIAREFIQQAGATPSFLGYQGYEYSTCISKNEEIVHGIPYASKELLPGDICCIDIGVYFKGFHADAARTHLIEPVDPEVEKLAQVTEQAFYIGAEKAIPGNTFGDIAHAMQTHIESAGLAVVRDLYSHGIGRELHEEPLIANYGKAGKGIRLKEGMTFALEPMVNIGTEEILTLDDKWTIITADHKWSAHYENTIAISKNGADILTI